MFNLYVNCATTILFMSVARQIRNSVLFLVVFYWTLCEVIEFNCIYHISFLQPDFKYVNTFYCRYCTCRNDEIKMFNQSIDRLYIGMQFPYYRSYSKVNELLWFHFKGTLSFIQIYLVLIHGVQQMYIHISLNVFWLTRFPGKMHLESSANSYSYT